MYSSTSANQSSWLYYAGIGFVVLLLLGGLAVGLVFAFTGSSKKKVTCYKYTPSSTAAGGVTVDQVDSDKNGVCPAGYTPAIYKGCMTDADSAQYKMQTTANSYSDCVSKLHDKDGTLAFGSVTNGSLKDYPYVVLDSCTNSSTTSVTCNCGIGAAALLSDANKESVTTYANYVPSSNVCGANALLFNSTSTTKDLIGGGAATGALYANPYFIATSSGGT